MYKTLFNCQTNTTEIIELTIEELAQRDSEIQASEDQSVLDSLFPSNEEIRKAETELLVIEILTEGGLL